MNTRPSPIRALVTSPVLGGGSFCGAILIAAMAGRKVEGFDPRGGDMKAVKRPTPGTGMRKMIVDARGRLGYLARMDAWAGCTRTRGPR